MTATLEQASERHDVALIKVNVPGNLTKVELHDNYDSIQKGEQVTIMGYPVGSPPVYGKIKSQDMFNREGQIVQIPQPTVTTSNIGNILRGNDKDSDKQTFSAFGDVYQLATNATGGGNSGGPVFDSQGKVIGIFFAGSNNAGMAVTYAVPIRFGMEFFQNSNN
jgi:serine protease Do